MPTLGSDLFDLALKDSGVISQGQTALASMKADTLRRANMMISQWSRRRWLVYRLVDTGLACTGAASYTVGAGGAFNIARPDRLEAAYLRQTIPNTSTPVDFPLALIESREDYSRIALKSLAASPSEGVFYDSNFPLGAVYPWPIPSTNYELHIVTKEVLQQFAAYTDALALPPEYEEAIYLNLMVRLRMAYRLPTDDMIVGLAKASLKTIRASNFQIAKLQMPGALRTPRAYNVYADR